MKIDSMLWSAMVATIGLEKSNDIRDYALIIEGEREGVYMNEWNEMDTAPIDRQFLAYADECYWLLEWCEDIGWNEGGLMLHDEPFIWQDLPPPANEKDKLIDYSNILTKLEGDSWPNLVILNSGRWFYASSIIDSYQKFGSEWVEFEVIKRSDCIHDICKTMNYLDGEHFRSISVNSNDISLIAERKG